MYVFMLMLIFIYIILGWFSRKEQVDKNVGALFRPFYRISTFLYKRICINKIHLFTTLQVKRDLQYLYPRENINLLETDYYIKKISLILIVCLIGTVFSSLVTVQNIESKILSTDGVVKRSDYTEGEQTLCAVADMGTGNSHMITVTMAERILTPEEAEALEIEFWDELYNIVLSNNNSLETVSEDLALVEELEGYPFAVVWSSDLPEYMSRRGEIGEIKKREGVEVKLTARITYGELEWVHNLSVQLMAPNLTDKERERQELSWLIEELEAASIHQEEWRLPQEFEGKNIIWREQIENNSIWMLLISFAVAFGIYFLMDKDLHSNHKKRRDEIKEYYPQIVNKMVLFLSAGMTIRGAFQKIAEDYNTQKKDLKVKTVVYEEMLCACQELRTGTSESIAYEAFGKRCGSQEYIRFCTLLGQNLKKGNSTLLNRLREESQKAIQEQMNRRMKIGEEASTKLLVPMIIMLSIVMVLVMIPAFSSF